MNLDNLHTIINRYENDLEAVYVKDANELFKWRAITGWQDAFHSSDVTGSGRSELIVQKSLSIKANKHTERPALL